MLAGGACRPRNVVSYSERPRRWSHNGVGVRPSRMFDPLRGRTVGIGAVPGGGKHPRLTSVVRPPACLLRAVLWGVGVRTSGTRVLELRSPGVASTPG